MASTIDRPRQCRQSGSVAYRPGSGPTGAKPSTADIRKKQVPMTDGSSQAAWQTGCGTPRPAMAVSTLASRSIVSSLLGRGWRGGRRNTIVVPSARVSRNRLFWVPPAICRLDTTGPSPGTSRSAIQAWRAGQNSRPSPSSRVSSTGVVSTRSGSHACR